MKVAFASLTGERVDEHFGWAQRFHIYEVGAAGWSLDTVRPITSSASDEEEEDRIALRLEAVAGCALLYVANIGGTAAARVIKARIHPIKLNGEPLIAETLDRLVEVLQGTPPPWLRKALSPAPTLLEEV